ncbi:hypothetical protein NPIL_535591 [Nephila pilipes]|uniref:Uncharacterized protein n=1 Tax=Nephila pilipes TaxID=299642 RepID=A0A8X6MQR3_NEPPI|nr:hypothetical protein NPIL_535591 [Nephila pilipes]
MSSLPECVIHIAIWIYLHVDVVPGADHEFAVLLVDEKEGRSPDEISEALEAHHLGPHGRVVHQTLVMPPLAESGMDLKSLRASTSPVDSNNTTRTKSILKGKILRFERYIKTVNEEPDLVELIVKLNSAVAL